MSETCEHGDYEDADGVPVACPECERDRLRFALEGAFPLAVSWAQFYATDYLKAADTRRESWHPKHRRIIQRIEAALAGEGE